MRIVKFLYPCINIWSSIENTADESKPHNEHTNLFTFSRFIFQSFPLLCSNPLVNGWARYSTICLPNRANFHPFLWKKIDNLSTALKSIESTERQLNGDKKWKKKTEFAEPHDDVNRRASMLQLSTRLSVFLNINKVFFRLSIGESLAQHPNIIEILSKREGFVLENIPGEKIHHHW